MLNKTTLSILFLFQLMILTTAQATVFTTIQTPNNGETKVVNILNTSNLTRLDDTNDIFWANKNYDWELISKNTASDILFFTEELDNGEYLFAIKATRSDVTYDKTFYSDPTKNGNVDHMVSWVDNNDPGHFFIAFEDWTDNDFNDAVYEITYNKEPKNVPEPQTLALLGLGIIGLGLSVKRRRRK